MVVSPEVDVEAETAALGGNVHATPVDGIGFVALGEYGAVFVGSGRGRNEGARCVVGYRTGFVFARVETGIDGVRRYIAEAVDVQCVALGVGKGEGVETATIAELLAAVYGIAHGRELVAAATHRRLRWRVCAGNSQCGRHGGQGQQ